MRPTNPENRLTKCFFKILKTRAILRMGNGKKKTGMQGVTEIGVVVG
jgi:hypothetical protein